MDPVFEGIEAELNTQGNPEDSTGCIGFTDEAVGAVIDHAAEIPEGTTILRCNNGATHDPHHWLQVTLPDGQKFIWDRSGVKLGGEHLVPVVEAQQIWSGFAAPEEALQVFPIVEE